MDTKDLCEHTRIRLIAAAVGHQQCTCTDGTEERIPGTRKRILIGDDAYLARVALPAAEKPTGDLTDEQIIEIMAKYSRCLEPGLYSQTEFDCAEDMIGFARAVERAAIAAHLERQAQAAPAAPEQVQAIPGLKVEEISPNFYHVSCGGVWSTAYEHTGDLGNKLLAKIAQAYLAAPVSQEGAHAALEEVRHIVEAIGVKAAIERATAAAASALTCKTCGADRSKDRCKAEHWQRCPMMGAAMSASQGATQEAK